MLCHHPFLICLQAVETCTETTDTEQEEAEVGLGWFTLNFSLVSCRSQSFWLLLRP